MPGPRAVPWLSLPFSPYHCQPVLSGKNRDMPTAAETPTWDLTAIFESLQSADYKAKFHAFGELVAEVTRLFDEHGIVSHAPISDQDVRSFESLAAKLNDLIDMETELSSYVYGFVTTDSRNAEAQSELSKLERTAVDLRKILRRWVAWVGTRNIPSLLTQSQVANDHAFYLEKSKVLVSHQMSQELEELAADLALTGSSAWERLHGDYTSQISVPLPDGPKSMAVVRNMAYDPDRAVRQTAYRAELATWEAHSLACAKAMNAIKGEVNTLSTRRGWKSALEEAVFANSIDEQTLDAMMTAARDAFPKLRQYMRAKAKLVSGQDRLAFYDMFAPIGKESREWHFDEGANFVIEQFGSFSPRMAALAQRAVNDRWIDAKPADGKRDGAFCMGVRPGRSLLLQTWKPSFGAVSTLAHELGHAYHNFCLTDRTALQREYPSTLAETASIFCETIICQAALKGAGKEESLAILESQLQRCTQTVVDISSRFLFEREVFERRQDSELSPNELCEVMSRAQEATYGDGLSDERHPYMWVAKPHYYSPWSFYNFPYMFGLLFSLGLYAQYQAEPKGFPERYDELLSRCGMADAATLADGFGINIRDRAFWDASLATVAADVDQFIALAEQK